MEDIITPPELQLLEEVGEGRAWEVHSGVLGS